MHNEDPVPGDSWQGPERDVLKMLTISGRISALHWPGRDVISLC
jgi:hypothetical protein